jgi:hypothetical protein
MLPSNPFKTAEDYIQLRKKYTPNTWAETMTIMSDMIIMPVIALFLLLTNQVDIFLLVSTVVKAYQCWVEYEHYMNLQSQVQMMFLHMSRVGGPFIRTNDMAYMPYVFADAVVRTRSS